MPGMSSSRSAREALNGRRLSCIFRRSVATTEFRRSEANRTCAGHSAGLEFPADPLRLSHSPLIRVQGTDVVLID